MNGSQIKFLLRKKLDLKPKSHVHPFFSLRSSNNRVPIHLRKVADKMQKQNEQELVKKPKSQLKLDWSGMHTGTVWFDWTTTFGEKGKTQSNGLQKLLITSGWDQRKEALLRKSSQIWTVKNIGHADCRNFLQKFKSNSNYLQKIWKTWWRAWLKHGEGISESSATKTQESKQIVKSILQNMVFSIFIQNSDHCAREESAKYSD